MKKFILMLLTAVMVVSLAAVSAQADGGLSVKIESTQSELTPSGTKETTITVKLINSSQQKIGSVEFTLDKAGLTQNTDNSTAIQCKSQFPGMGSGPSFDGTSFSAFAGDKPCEEQEVTLLEITYQVEKTTPLNKTLSLSSIKVGDETGGDPLSCNTTASATYTIKHSTEDDHSYPEQPTRTDPDTCTTAETKHFVCQADGCDQEKTETGADTVKHDWSGDIDWSEWDKTKATSPETGFTAKLKCKNCEQQITTTATVKKVNTPEKCTEDGNDTYTAHANFKTVAEVSSQPGSETLPDKDYEQPYVVTIPKKGHDWQEPVVTWASHNVTNVKITCKNGCEEYGSGKDLSIPDDVKVSFKEVPPTCTTEGSKAYTADITAPDNGKGERKTFTSQDTDGKETIPATGHTLDEDSVKFTWPELKDKGTPPEVTVTARCSAEGCLEPDLKLSDGTNKVTAKAKTTGGVKGDDKDPTYLEGGQYTFEATATFKKGPDAETFEDKTEQHTYTVDPLPAPTTAPTVAEDKVSEPETAKSVVAESVQAAVQSALTNKKAPEGMDSELYEAIEKAGEGGAGDPMTITTTLEVTDKDSDVPDSAPALKPETGELAKYYDIDIKVQITGHDGTDTTGYIHKVDDEITFKLPKAGAGPIYYVSRYHQDEGWKKLPTRIVGDDLVFSSDRFSPYAIVSSADIADATVSPDPIPDQTYTGKAIEPKIEVYINGDTKLTAGTDYELVYADNTEVGEAAITIKALEGNTHGLTAGTTKELTFQIVKAPAAGGGSGSTSAPGTVVPATGDETPLTLYAALLTPSAAALTFVLARRRRQK